MRALALLSDTSCAAWVSACVLGLVLVSCRSSTEGNAAAVGEEAKGGANGKTGAARGRTIAPPPGGDQILKNQQAADQLLSQIPESARSGNAVVSLPYNGAPVGSASGAGLSPEEQRRRATRARPTDSEIVGPSQGLDGRYGSDVSAIDRTLGVEPSGGRSSSPSYLMKVEEIKVLFVDRRFEEALVETNELLRFYPRTAQLLMMKGTLHQRLGQVDLALASYRRAFEYEPSRKLQVQIEYLQDLIAEREKLRQNPDGLVAPAMGGGR